jgi:hypothetical protein
MMQQICRNLPGMLCNETMRPRFGYTPQVTCLNDPTELCYPGF